MTTLYCEYQRRVNAIHLWYTAQRRTKKLKQNANFLSNSIDVERGVTSDVQYQIPIILKPHK